MDERGCCTWHPRPNLGPVATAVPGGNYSHLACKVDVFGRISVLVEKRLSLAVDRHIDQLAHAKSEQDAFLYPRIYAPSRLRSGVGLRRTHLAAIQRDLEGVEGAPVFFRVLRWRAVK